MTDSTPFAETYIQLETANTSGELIEIYLGGTSPNNKVAIIQDVLDHAGGDDALFYGGIYQEGSTYEKNYMCFKDGWLAVVTAESTTENFVPSTDGIVTTVGPNELLTDLSNLGTVVQKTIVSFLKDQILTEVQVYIPEISDNLFYTLIVSETTSEPHRARVFPVIVNNTGWITAALETLIVLNGTTLEFSLLSENRADDQSFTYPWVYQGMVSAGVSSGEWNLNPSNTLFRISFIDDDGNYRASSINNLVVGSTLRAEDAATPGIYREYTITELREDNPADTSFVMVSIDSAGILDVGAECNITGTNYIPATTPYNVTDNYWDANQPNWGVVSGGLILDGDEQTGVESNAYGVRVFTENVVVSEDWQLLAGSGSVVASGGDNLYDFTKVENFVVPETTYTEVARLERTIEEGIYEIKMSFTYQYDTANSSSYFRFSIDGGNTWAEFAKEPKDTTDATPFYYGFPKSLPSGEFSFIMEARKENSNPTLTISFLDLILDQKI